MSVLVGAANKSFSGSTASFTTDRILSEIPSTTAAQSGPPPDGFALTSPGNLVRQINKASQLGEADDVVVVASKDELCSQLSKKSASDSEKGEEDEDEGKDFVVTPLVALKDQLEKDKDDESLRKWKEQLLGSLQFDPRLEEGVDPEVHVTNFCILSPGRPDIIIPLPLPNNKSGHLFTLKEGTSYQVKFTFKVCQNIVSGLSYEHTVWKRGFKVEKTRIMLGTYGPQIEPYTEVMEEEMTPSGLLARGSYTARTRLIDDDGRCHLDIQHTFKIHKDW